MKIEIINLRRGTPVILLKKIILVSGFVCTGSVFADHEPLEYFYNAAKNPKAFHSARLSPPSISRDLPMSKETNDDIKSKLDDVIDGSIRGGLAAIAVSRGEIVYERHLNNKEKYLYPSWSVAKSLTAITLGYALCSGKIRSLDDKAEEYSDLLKNTVWGRAKIRDLLIMASGASTRGLDSVTGDIHTSLGSLDQNLLRGRTTLKEAFRNYGIIDNEQLPGTKFAYNNLDTLAISTVVEGATGVTFHEYFEKTLWRDSGAKYESVWYLDRDKRTLTSAYFFASIEDYARITQFIVDAHKEKINDSCLSSFVKEAMTHKISSGGDGWYGYQFWLGSLRRNVPISKMMGHQGQEIFINSDNGKIIVALGYHSSIRVKLRDRQQLIPWLVKP